MIHESPEDESARLALPVLIDQINESRAFAIFQHAKADRLMNSSMNSGWMYPAGAALLVAGICVSILYTYTYKLSCLSLASSKYYQLKYCVYHSA